MSHLMTTAAKIFLPLAVVVSIVIGFCMANDNLVMAVLVAAIPIFLSLTALAFKYNQVAFLMLFVANYFLPTLGRYNDEMSVGLFIDIAIAFNFIVILGGLLSSKKKRSSISKKLLIPVFIWLIYCTIEVFNSRMLDVQAWMSSLRSMALYFLMIIILVQLCITDLKHVKQILAVWSILIIIATIKVFYQRYVGWTPGDYHFLYDLEGASTHIIWYGIRYFSIFSDAANYGGSMAMAMGVYIIVGFHTKNWSLRIYWWAIAAMGCLGMFISGTRSALPVPVATILVYLVLIKDFKKMVPLGIFLALTIGFLAFTTIGEGVTAIRRARTVFHRADDPSYITRKDNQALLRDILDDMPMGNSLGMSGSRGKEYGDKSAITEIPTDSWYVQIWVETGIIGLVIYFIAMLFIFFWGCYLVFFKLKDPEVKGITAGFIAGVIGLFVMSSNNEVFSQIPNGVIVYTLLSIVFLSPKLDKQALEKHEGITDNSQL